MFVSLADFIFIFPELLLFAGGLFLLLLGAFRGSLAHGRILFYACGVLFLCLLALIFMSSGSASLFFEAFIFGSFL